MHLTRVLRPRGAASLCKRPRDKQERNKDMKRAFFAALVGTSMLVAPAVVLAKQTSEPAAMASKQAASKADYDHMMKLSDDGFRAVRDVRAARIAIFNAAPDKASKNLDEAISDIGKAQKDAKTFVGRSNATDSFEDWIPVDATIDISDNFTVDAEKKQHVAEANAHLKAGNGHEAVEKLKLAEIDVNLTRFMMPVRATTNHLKVAKSLLDKKKYYEANLALKAAEDGLVVDTVALVDLPKNSATAHTPAGATPSAASPKQASSTRDSGAMAPSSN